MIFRSEAGTVKSADSEPGHHSDCGLAFQSSRQNDRHTLEVRLHPPKRPSYQWGQTSPAKKTVIPLRSDFTCQKDSHTIEVRLHACKTWAYSPPYFRTSNPVVKVHEYTVFPSVAYPRSGASLTPGSGIRDGKNPELRFGIREEHLGTYFWELSIRFLD